MSFGQLFPICLAVALDLLVLYYLARGPGKRFPFVFLLCVTQVVCAFADTIASILIGARSHVYLRIYWTGDMLAHAVISLLMLSLIWQTLEQHQRRRDIVAFLMLAVVCFALYSVYIFQNPSVNRWMTSVSRNLSFCEEF